MAEREPVTGDVLGDRYEIQSELGRGGMATVYRGRDLRLQRRVAVKVFRDAFAESVDPQRRTQEMQLLASVNHPSVVAVLDASTGDGVFGAYLVMELVVGDDLGALLHRARGPLSADFARRIVADVAGALQALHERGVVHRDVKPANILVPVTATSPTAAVAAKLTDFGIAQLVDGAAMTAPETILGTAAYLSPEQVRGAPPRPASDVYSLGLVLLEALTGARAFPGAAAEAAMARLHRPPALPPGASPALADLLSRMTALDPAHRPAAAEVAAALRGQLAGRVAALDATATAPTPIAGIAAHRPMLGADQTAPHDPLWTPSRGMPLGTGAVATGGVRTGAVSASGSRTGSVSAGGARTGLVASGGSRTGSTAVAAPRRRFPTVLAVAASVLAAAVAGVAISAAAGTETPAPAAAAGGATQDEAAPAQKPETSTSPRPAEGLAVAIRPSRSPKPRPTRSATPSASPSVSAPTPSTTPTAVSPEPAPPAPPEISEAPSAPPSEVASAPPASTPPSESPAPAPAPPSSAPAVSAPPSADPADGDVVQQTVVSPEQPAAGTPTT